MPIPLQNAKAYCHVDEETINGLLVTEDDSMVSTGYWLVPENNIPRHTAISIIYQKVAALADLGENSEYLPFLTLNYYDRYMSRAEQGYMAHPDAVYFIVLSCWILALKITYSYVDHVLEYDPEARAVENHVSTLISFNLNSVTPLNFVDYFIQVVGHWVNNPTELRCWAIFCVKLMFYNIKVLKFRPSIIAACSVLSKLSNHPHFKEILHHLQSTIGLNLEQLLECFHSVTPH